MAKIKHKNYLLFSLIVIILILSGVFIYPSISKINDNNKKIEAEKIKLENNIETDKKLKMVQDNQDLYNNLKANLSSVLIEGENSLDLIIPLENIARDLGLQQNLEILEAEVKKTNEKNEKRNPLDSLPSQNIRLQLSGEFKNILNYFNKLREVGIIYDINDIELKQRGYSLEFNKGQSEADIGITEAIIEIKFFTK